MIVALICAAASASLFLVAIALFGGDGDVSRRIAELESTAQTRAKATPNPLAKRLLANVDGSAVAKRLAEAGWYQTSVLQFVVSRFICAAVTGAIAAFYILATGHLTTLFELGVVVIAGFGFVLPSFRIDAAIKARKKAIGNRLPDFLDMVSTTVEAGTALNSALATATNSITGPLAEEIEIVLSDVRMGRSRADAFEQMAERVNQPDLDGLVLAIVQTERLGGNIGKVLDELAEEARARRMQRAEEIAASLPVKMVVPMALFMLPALIVMIFTPVAAQFFNR